MSLILFDFDGVLADTLGDLLQFGQEACDELGVKHTATQDDLNSLEIMSFATYGRQMEVPDHLVDEFVRRCLAKFGEKKSPPDIFEGLDEVIRELSASNAIAVITGNSSENVKAFLAAHGLDEFIRAIYGVDSPGSKAEKISLAQNQFAAQGEAVFMVGDSASDIHAAKEASVKSIAVSWGHQSAETLIRAEPDYLVHSPGELHEVMEKNHSKKMEAMRNKFPVAVHIFFLRDAEILLLRRFNTGYEDGKYSVVAGHVDTGETTTQAAIREVGEEVGVTLEAKNIQIVHVMHRKSEDERIDFFMTVRQWSGEIVNNEPHKCDELAWHPIARLPQNTIPYVRHAIGCFQNGIAYSEFGWE